MIGIRGTALDTETKELLQEIKPGSVILFKRNIKSASQVKRLVLEIKGLLPDPPLIAVDQEGGLVVRFTRDITVFPGNMALGAAGSVDFAFQQGLASAGELKNIGIDVNLAPAVDVITTYHNPGITIRSFGDDPHKVAELAAAYIKGTQEARVAAAAKHFPGKGAAEVDAHLDLPVVSIPEQTFKEIHMLPFKKVIESGVKGIMSTHIYCPSLEREEKRPATFSPEIIHHFLREIFHFTGVIFSDDLEMGAIARYYSIGDTCIQAVLSGHDFLLICSDYQKQREGFSALLAAYENSALSLQELEASLERIQSLKDFCRESPDKKYSPAISQAPQLLARQIADQSITLAGDKKGLLPLKDEKEKRIVLIMPDLSVLDAIEEGYYPSEEHFFLKELKNHFTGKVKPCFLSVELSGQDIEETMGLVSKKDTVIALIFDAQAHEGQLKLVQRLKKTEADIIWALIRNPFDIEFLNPDDTCLITYGFRKVQLISLAKVIFGEIKAGGCLPFSDKRLSHRKNAKDAKF